MTGTDLSWQAELIFGENGRQKVQMAGRTKVEVNGRQNWQAKSYLLKMAGNRSEEHTSELSHSQQSRMPSSA